MARPASLNNGSSRSWARSYPPLVLGVIAILIAALVLPSALNLPQSDPSTVLEFAPIPPTDEDVPPPDDGNLQTLALASSDTLSVAPPPPPPPPPPLDEGLGGRPQQMRCVGDPPRQTEDLSSPPCVPFFDGDNFGETYQGVSGEEITVVVYVDAATYGQAGRSEPSYVGGTWIDVDRDPLPPCPQSQNVRTPATDPDSCDHLQVRMVRAMARYFNTRFQTYQRRVHYWVYYTSAETAAARRGDAVEIWEKRRPFAVIDDAIFGGFNREFQEALSQLGVLTFSSSDEPLPNSFYRSIAPLSWGFYPDIERAARLYTTYVCQKVSPNPVHRYGANPGQGAPNGQPRKLGLWWPDDPAYPDFKLFANLVKDGLTRCGARWDAEATYSNFGYAVDATETGGDAVQAVAQFQSAGVTTILYIGTETRLSASADAIRYYPEIVVAGNLSNDNNFIGTVQNRNVWRNAWAMSYHIRINRLQDSPGFRAVREGDPNLDDGASVYARDAYRDHFMLFQAIQVAGPRLMPETVEEGFHAIPERASSDPFIGAFFFEPGDYTSLKDGVEQWWDPSGFPLGAQQPGCWRMVREGKRYLSGTWEGGNDVFANQDDPCTAYGGGIRLRFA